MTEPNSINGTRGTDDGPSPADLLRNEVANETATVTAVPFRGGKLRVKHQDDWPSSANEDLQYGRFASWGEKALATPEDVDTWLDADPTNREVQEFLTAWGEATGMGKAMNREARRLSQRTR